MIRTAARVARRDRVSTRQRAGASEPGKGSPWFECGILALYLSLLYKLALPGALLLVTIGSAHMVMRDRRWPVYGSVAALGIAYAALATVTAFMVDRAGGVERTIQFLFSSGTAIAICRYLASLDRASLHAFVRRFLILNVAVLVHVLAFHLTQGHLTTWKYLRDTKFIFSALIIILFFYEDAIKRRSVLLWAGALGGLSCIILLSGERKAYILLVLVFLISRTSITAKLAIGAVVAGLLLAMVSISPDSYVARQIESGAVDENALPDRYFLSVQGISDHSDIVRAFVNRNAQRLFEKHPILGVGATGYLTWARNTYGSLAESNGRSMNVHGELHRVPAESGLVGIAVAMLYLMAVFTRIFAYIERLGGFNAPSPVRTPLYIALLLICYISAEAMDTTMLLLILMVGFLTAGLNVDVKRKSLRIWRAAPRLNRLA